MNRASLDSTRIVAVNTEEPRARGRHRGRRSVRARGKLPVPAMRTIARMPESRRGVDPAHPNNPLSGRETPAVCQGRSSPE